MATTARNFSLINNEMMLSESLASKVDEVRIGLPDEYVKAVISGIETARLELGSITSGKLSVTCAAHGATSSSAAIFSGLSIFLIKLLNSGDCSLSDSELVELFPKDFR